MHKLQTGTSTLKIILMVLFALILSACQLNYPIDTRTHLDIELAYVEIDTLHKNGSVGFSDFNDLEFEAFNPSEPIAFRQLKKDVVFKIEAAAFNAEVSEATLTVSPKYFAEVSYTYLSPENQTNRWQTQYRNKTNNDRYFSSQNYAFNIDDDVIQATHYLLIKSSTNLNVDIQLVDTQSYIRADMQHSQFFTVVYSIILAMILFNGIFYIYNRDSNYLLYIIYMSFALYSLLWQEGKINDLPQLAWYVLGTHSGMLFIMLTDLAAIMFFYNFMNMKANENWWARTLLVIAGFKVILLLWSVFQFYVQNNLNYNLISTTFNLSVILTSLLIWIILLVKTWQKAPQAKYLFVAWSIMILTVFLRIFYALNPQPEYAWMPQTYELGIMLEGLVLAFAMANRTMRFKSERDDAMIKYSKAERANFEHQLITQFQNETQELVKNPTLTEAEVVEKINIKFHLLMNKAYQPIQSSFIRSNNELAPICMNGLNDSDITAINKKLIKLRNHHNRVKRFEINSHDSSKTKMLMVPLYENTEQEILKNALLVFAIKDNRNINQDQFSNLKHFCEIAYEALQQAHKTHQVALAANLDSMTGCHNRGSIEKIIQDSLLNHSRTTLAFIDLDDLKDINDQHGHDIGDQCIIELVQLLNEALNTQCKLGRIGGDEFVAVFSDVNFESCEDIFDELMTKLPTFQFSDENLNLSISVGLAESRINETSESLLKKADLALYYAKDQGKNLVVVFEQSMAVKK